MKYLPITEFGAAPLTKKPEDAGYWTNAPTPTCTSRSSLRSMAVRRKSSSNPDHRRNYGLFRELLLQLSNSLTANELEELKFLCGDVLPRGRLDSIKQGFELFQALEHLNKLSLEKRDFLASKLSALDRVDLSNKLLGTEG